MKPINIGVAGHAGVGHVNGYSGFIQDDSGGFVTVSAILRGLLDADTRIENADADPGSNTITITTKDGGTFLTSPRRGITPGEARLINAVRGQDALFCQSLAVKTFGRMYGQGVMETPVAFEAALANAVVDTFRKKAHTRFKITQEDFGINCGLIGGLSTNVDRVSVSFLASVNYTRGGIGPAEDMEGNVALGSKGELMRELDMLKCPTIIVEGKAYLPAISNNLKQNTFLVRAQEGIDNMIVAQALFDSAKELGYPVLLRKDALPGIEGVMAQQTMDFAERIIALAERLKRVGLATDKVLIVAEMAKLISQDAGAITCISNKLHDVVRGVGMIPGTSAVLSMLVSRDYYAHWKIPLFEQGDAEMFKNIIMRAIEKVGLNYEAALEILERFYTSIAAESQNR